MDKNKIQRIKLIIAIIVVLVVATFITIRVAKYQSEGEKNMPFNLSKIIIISTASQNKDKINQEPTENAGLWNFDIIQKNDVYISIENNEDGNKKNEKIKNVTIQNIQITENPSIGSIKTYMPNSTDGEKYKYTDEYIVSESLTYRGANESNYKNLQISKTGGKIGISFANTEVGKYSSGEDTEINYNGTMLSKLGITDEKLKFKVSFDLVIETDRGKKYLGNVQLEIPCNELVEKGRSQQEITDFSGVVFKRI